MAQTLVDPRMLDSGNLKVGFTNTEHNYGTQSSGTLTVDPLQAPQAYYTNGGAHTLAPASAGGAQDILVTNNGSAGAITTSSFEAVLGDSLDTTDTNQFLLQVKRINSVDILIITALQ